MFKEYIHIWTLSAPELVPCSLAANTDHNMTTEVPTGGGLMA